MAEGWNPTDRGLTRSFRFRDFRQALGFVVAVGRLAEKANHHPDVDIRWNEVTLALMTHREGRITSQDEALADAINDMDLSRVIPSEADLFPA
jgi:4a-hydroxytetrahydrobiopterin dehydratase